MIFQNRQEAKFVAENLGRAMAKSNINIRLHSGELSNEDRSKTMEEFMTGNCQILITTDVLSRAIDIENVVCVFNYGLPIFMKDLVDLKLYNYRIGRCGRFGKPGIAISFLNASKYPHVAKSLQNDAKFI